MLWLAALGCNPYHWAADCDDFARANHVEPGFVRLSGELDGVPFAFESDESGVQAGCVEPMYGLEAGAPGEAISHAELVFSLESEGYSERPHLTLLSRGVRFENVFPLDGTIERVSLVAERPSEWSVEGSFEGVVTTDGETEVPVFGEFEAETTAPARRRDE